MTRRVLGLLAHLRSEERGAVLVLMGAAMFGLIGMTALTVDAARYFELSRQLQNGVDAAAQAATVKLPEGPGAASAAATEYWNLNQPSLGDATLVDVSFPDGESRVRVEAEATIEFLFAPVMGFLDATVSASAEVALDARTVDVIVVIDRSGSMCLDSHGLMLECSDPPPQWEPFMQVQDAAIAFPDFIMTHTEDRLGLVSYSTDTTRDIPLSQGYAGFINQIEFQVQNLVPGGYTNIGGALAEAYAAVTQGSPNTDAEKIIVLLSDGVPNVYPALGNGWEVCVSGCAESYNYGLTEAEHAADNGVDIYTIGLGGTVDHDYMEQLATIGNGTYIFSPTPEELDDAFAQVARLIRVKFVE